MWSRIKSDPSVSRAMNRRLILNLLRRNGDMSRAALAIATGLSAPAVTSVVADLIDHGYVREGQPSPGLLGRRPVPIGLNYAGHIAIGVKLMVGAIEGVATDLATTPIRSLDRRLDDQRPETFVAAIADVVDQLSRQGGKAAPPVVGVGVSLPGIIDADRGICRRSERLDWTEVPLAAMVAERTGTPVWLEDDTNAYALAQHLFGLGRHHANMAALAIGAGIGCSMIIDGKLYRGGHGAAGKLGHVLHNADGPRCECGRRGCLQAWYAERAIVSTWERGTAWDGERGHDGLVAAIAAGDPCASHVLAEAGTAIGTHLATFAHMMDPEIIVVGGEAVAFGDALFGPMREALARFAFRSPPPLRPDWDGSSWARGAAALATQHVFDFEQSGISGHEGMF
jgi:predicted NBD/HSP70 family sugar kinase